MKQTIISIIILFISCDKNKTEMKIEENCYDVLYSVSYVTDAYDKRNVALNQLINEIKSNSKIDNENLIVIEELSEEIKRRVDKSLNELNEEHKNNQSEKIFEISIKYLSKVKELEEIVPSFIREVSNNTPNTNFELKNSMKKYTNEVKELGYIFHKSMNDYYKMHQMSNVKLDSIENVIEEKIKNIKY